jgi:hypothetical protein
VALEAAAFLSKAQPLAGWLLRGNYNLAEHPFNSIASGAILEGCATAWERAPGKGGFLCCPRGLGMPTLWEPAVGKFTSRPGASFASDAHSAVGAELLLPARVARRPPPPIEEPQARPPQPVPQHQPLAGDAAQLAEVPEVPLAAAEAPLNAAEVVVADALNAILVDLSASEDEDEALDDEAGIDSEIVGIAAAAEAAQEEAPAPDAPPVAPPPGAAAQLAEVPVPVPGEITAPPAA